MQSERGVTLVEMLVTMAILTVLLGMAVPGLKWFVDTNRQSSTTNSLVVTLNYARSEAVKLDKFVSLCASSDGKVCTNQGWSTGWIVFIDEDGDGAVDTDQIPKDEVLRVHQIVGGNLSVAAGDSGTAINFVTFDRKGLADKTGKFAVCYDNDKTKAKLIVLKLTSVRLAMNDTESVINSCASP